jgi:kynurenine formamidase
LKNAKYVDLTHTITPSIPVWAGFGPTTFGPTVNPKTGTPYTWAKDGFEASRYVLATDQLGTQLDPPAHWNPDYPGIDELPATFAVRPLVVISIADQVANQPGYHLSVEDIQAWEAAHGRIPEGSVVFVRSGWSNDWPNPDLSTRRPFPGVSLAALKFLHEQRHILFHGHEPLDTDTTGTLEGEAWLLQNGYTQAEGVANLDKVPETGALVEIGFPRSRAESVDTRASSPSARRTGSTVSLLARYQRVPSPRPLRHCIGTRSSACGCDDNVRSARYRASKTHGDA